MPYPKKVNDVVIVIPARYRSERLPGKPLVDVCGKPLIQWVWELANRVEEANRVVVAVDDVRVETAVKQFGGEAIMTSSQHRCGTERLAEVAAKLPAKLYVNLQGDEPLARVEDISLLIKSMEAEGQADAGTLCHAITLEEAADPNVVKVVFDHQGFALYFSRSRIPYERDGNGAAVSYWKHVGIYAFRPPALQIYNPNQNQPEMEQLEKLEQLRMLWHGLKIRVWQTTASAQGVDTPDQLNQVRQILAERIRNGI